MVNLMVSTYLSFHQLCAIDLFEAFAWLMYGWMWFRVIVNSRKFNSWENLMYWSSEFQSGSLTTGNKVNGFSSELTLN